jgi:hypothetical protein
MHRVQNAGIESKEALWRDQICIAHTREERRSISSKSSVLDIYEFIASLDDEMDHLIGASQVAWRCGSGDASEFAEQAVKAGIVAAGECTKFRLKPGRDDVPFNFGLACEFSYLVRGEFLPDLVKMLPTLANREQWTTHPYELVEAALVLTMVKGRKLPKWDEFLTTIFRKKLKARHFAASFELYMALILAALQGNWDAMPLLVGQADENYITRVDDELYRNFDTRDGSSMYNAVRIDYRLATILKWAYRDRAREFQKLTTIHRWPFS